MLYWLLLPSVFANIIDVGFTNLPGQITKMREATAVREQLRHSVVN
jgi:hypothetical protein